MVWLFDQIIKYNWGLVVIKIVHKVKMLIQVNLVYSQSI